MGGCFITFEGTEGSGKTTQIKILARRLVRLGHTVVTTREPGGTRFGEQIRQVLLSLQNRRLDPRAELFLYLASRTQHLEEVILPALRKGCIVLCDRFSDATLAYQGFGRRLDAKFVHSAVGYAAKRYSPDLTLLLDLEVRVGLARVRNRGGSNRLDREEREFHERVRSGYLRLARLQPRRIKVVNAFRETEELADEILTIVHRRLKRRTGVNRDRRTAQGA